MAKKKVIFIISNIEKAMAFEWLASSLNKDRFDLHFILLNPGGTYLEDFLLKKNIPVDRIIYTGKKDLPKAVVKCIRILLSKKPDVVHTHLFDASLAGLTASKFAGIKKRIYTRHHSTSNHDYHPNAVKYDKLCNYLSTDIVATSENVKRVLIEKEKVNPVKIHLIHHGFDLDAFQHVNEEEVTGLKARYGLAEKNFPVIGTISRYIELKGVQYIIPAFRKLLDHYPNAMLILANAEGNYKPEIKKAALDNSAKELHRNLF